jgi:hypothetical protein
MRYAVWPEIEAIHDQQSPVSRHSGFRDWGHFQPFEHAQRIELVET